MNSKFKNVVAPNSTITYDKNKVEMGTGNIYESIVAISKRANQINVEIKNEIKQKMEEFTIFNDSTEEIFENREQIETSKFFEILPKATSIAIDEWLNQKVMIEKSE